MSSHGSGDFHHDKATTNQNELTRQMTVSLTPEQYERLFFQPSAPKGDLAKRLGNPTLLGILGFLIPFSCTVFALLDFQGSSTNSLVSFSGTFYMFGGIAMNIAAIGEFILGNSFPLAVFMIFGCHWVYLGYVEDPVHMIGTSYAVGDVPGALSQAYNAGQGNYNCVLALVCFIFLIGSLRVNVPFVIVFSTLIFVFGFFAAGYWQLGYNPTAAGVSHAVYYFKIAGGFGFVTIMMGWYLAIIQVCATTGVPCPLPVFDLSSKVFAHDAEAQRTEHAGANTRVPANQA